MTRALWLGAGLLCFAPVQAAVDVEKQYLLGVDALNTGYYDLAITQFETVLLYYPQHRGALIDLAIALCASGDAQACDSSREDLLLRLADVPQISHLLTAIEPKRWQHMTQLDLGFSDNLNKGLSDKQLNMSVQGVPVTLTLQDTSISQSGYFQDLTHYTTWQSTSLFPRWESWGYAYVRQLETGQKNQLHLATLGLKRRLQTVDKSQRYAFGVGFSTLSYTDTYQYHAPSLLFDWQMPLLPWQPKFEFAWEDRALQKQSAYSQVQTWALTLYPASNVQLRFEVANETSQQSERIDNVRQALQLLWSYPVSTQVQVSVLAQSLLSSDGTPYAPPLIEEVRHYAQNRLRLALTGALTQGASWQCSVSKGWQDANHPLFAWQEQSAQCGVFVVY